MNSGNSDLPFLQAAGRALLSRTPKAKPLSLPADDRGIELLQRHGLLAALHTDADLKGQAMPPSLRLAAEQAHRRTLRSNLQIVGQMTWLLGRLRSAGIDFLVMKGPVVSDAVWGHLGARGFGDIDFLVREETMDTAADRLRAEGFEEAALPLAYERVFLHHARSLKVELHSRLVSREFLPRLDPARARAAAIVRLVPGIGPIPTLGDEFHFLFTAVHAAKHLLEFFFPPCPIIRLGLYVEIARWAERAPGFDWERVLHACDEIRCRRAVLHAPACARVWFDWSPPEPLARAIDATPGLSRLVSDVTAGIGIGHLELKRDAAQLWRQARVAAGLRDSGVEGAVFALRYFARPLGRRLTGRA